MLSFKNWKQIKESKEELKSLAQKAKINLNNINFNQLKKGIEVEKEHDGKMGKDIDVVKNKTDLIKIAVAHLREDPKYYSKLEKIEKK